MANQLTIFPWCSKDRRGRCEGLLHLDGHQVGVQPRLPGRRALPHVAHEALEGLGVVFVRANRTVPEVILHGLGAALSAFGRPLLVHSGCQLCRSTPTKKYPVNSSTVPTFQLCCFFPPLIIILQTTTELTKTYIFVYKGKHLQSTDKKEGTFGNIREKTQDKYQKRQFGCGLVWAFGKK